MAAKKVRPPMTLIEAATGAVERLPVPDAIARAGISLLVGRTGRHLADSGPEHDAGFAAAMAAFPIAVHTDAANEQHYELPAEFFALALGPRKKYSCCLFDGSAATLAEAEEFALAETAAHADLADGQDILELGCGWGSLSLWMAEKFPAARITAVSNSAGQRRHIEAAAARLGLANLRAVTADMNAFEPEATFDRVVSVEMFEHMANWSALLARVRLWLRPHGKLFVHVFSHRAAPYRFDLADRGDWIAKHFFTGGIMPSHGLMRQFSHLFAVEREWRWNGRHYARTADAWLANYDRNAGAIAPILREVYGDRAALWRRRWRLFFLATAGLFGHDGGAAWGISHYRMRPVA
jgi:cyclopropane-fatty-acyl-phospholipid synthase